MDQLEVRLMMPLASILYEIKERPLKIRCMKEL